MELTLLSTPEIELATAVDRAREYVAAAKAPNTLKAYKADWRHFTAWCHTHDLEPLPAAPHTVAAYISSLAEWAKASTIQRRLSAISQAHQAAELDTPTAHLLVRSTMAGIRRTIGTAQHGKAPVVTARLRAMVGAQADGLAGARNRAVLLVGFATAFRRSELVALDIDDVADTADGLVVTQRRSKTDQEGEGRTVGVPYGSKPDTCPVRAYQAWLQASGITAGPVFRPVDRHGHLHDCRLSDRAVADIVKNAAAAIGLDPSRFAGHSLRAGLITAAAAAGVEERIIANQSGHKSMTVLRRYIREGSLFRENAAGDVGL